MDEHHTRRRLIGMLRSAYSGELAAALAYRAHWRALSNTAERAAIARIEREEWTHREEVGVLLARLGAKPIRLREIVMTIVGCGAGACCHAGSWILPMYFAGRLEHANIREYEEGAEYAHTLGLPDFERALLAMAAVERDHEAFFLRTVAAHPWLPALKRVFSWGDQTSALTIRRARNDDAIAMVQVRRQAILAKTRSSYAQPAIDAWAAETTPERAVRYRQVIADPQFVVVVAEYGDAMIGFATAVPGKRELSALYVKPNPVGQVGRALLAELEQRAFRTAETLLCVAALGAVQFYEANGYTRQGGMTFVDGSGAGVPCMRMKKSRSSGPSRPAG